MPEIGYFFQARFTPQVIQVTRLHPKVGFWVYGKVTKTAQGKVCLDKTENLYDLSYYDLVEM